MPGSSFACHQLLLALSADPPSVACPLGQQCVLPGQTVMCVCMAGARKHYSKDCDGKLAVLWLILVQPLLFGAIGTEIDFREIQGSLIWKTVIILALGQSCDSNSTVTTYSTSRMVLIAPLVLIWCCQLSPGFTGAYCCSV